MKELAILFWFYKKPLICKNHLLLLKRNNPGLRIYGLYGGDLKKVDRYKKILGEYLDDFYASPFKNSKWKWINGDLILLDWFRKRGKNLSWESLAVVQWDMLVFGKLAKIFRDAKRNQLYFSAFRSLDKDLENCWMWTKPGSIHRKNYLNFRKHIKKIYGYDKKILCCLFIFQIFTRSFFEKYSLVKKKYIGMLEYKIPTYAKIFKIPIFQKDTGARWFTKKLSKTPSPLNADSNEVSKTFIKSELRKKNGFRMFHPFNKIWNDSQK
ncbi:MAG: hypothetical protein Q8L09_02840 [Candidatus Moranbacteria bacterium]|nr:hypothetical protein [Candidatus Moranbacteria bacterium]